MKDLTSTKLLTKNSLINIIGNIVPLILAVIVIPIIIEYYGKERFAILSILWAVIGYFSFIDLGLSRTLTIIISEKLGSKKTGEISILVTTALITVVLLGVFGTVIILYLSSWLVLEKFQISQSLENETLISMYIIAFSIPIVTLSSSLKGILVAYQKFLFINIQRILLGLIMFVSPLIFLLFSTSLVPIILFLAISRFIILIFYIRYIKKTFPKILQKIKYQVSLLPRILKFGGWLTITNIVGPVMSYFDRFFIGMWISMAAVTYYVLPHEIVSKILILPSAIMNVLFPAFSYVYHQNKARSISMLEKTTKLLIVIMFPISIFFIVFSNEILDIWLGEEFALNSTVIMQILLIGVFFNSLGVIYFLFFQSIGKPHLTAISHMIQLPIYLILLWLAIKSYGGEGAAFAWSTRILIDTSVLMIMVLFFYFKKAKALYKLYFLCIVSIITLAIPILINDFLLKIVYFLVVCVIMLGILWYGFFDTSDKSNIKKLFKFRREI
jgi:O-antigen/teichoic acid export membrane protein